MIYCHKILFQSFVKPFYKENAGAFLFFLIILFCIIGKVDGAELFEYHLSLAKGILQNFSFLLMVLFAWLLYTRKFVGFVSRGIIHPQFQFLQVFNQLSKAKRFRLFFLVETELLLPVLLYCLFLFYVTLGMHTYLPIVVIGLYLVLLACIAALWHVRILDSLSAGNVAKPGRFFAKWKGPVSYKNGLLVFVLRQQRFVWAGIKIFTCGLLYLIARNNTAANYDPGMAFIFYTFGILANGVLIFRIRNFEETYLSFYKGLAVPLMKRFFDYCFVYAVLFVPELLTILSLYPAHLYGKDAVGFMLSGFSTLLFMNGLTFYDDFSMKEYLKILFSVFFISCLLFTSVGLSFLNAIVALSAILLFIKGYYRFEKIYTSA